MFFRRPGMFDRVVEVFRYSDMSLLYLCAKRLKSFDIGLCGECEKLFVLLEGGCVVGGYELFERDMLYLPRGVGEARVVCGGGCVIYVLQVGAAKSFRPYVKRFGEAKGVVVGDSRSRRVRYVLVGEEDNSERILAGYTFCEPGSWGSYPPHRHDDMYEVFVYFGLDPYFGIQTVLDEDGEEVYIVRDYDIVLATHGYHPNVSTPARGMRYLWVMVSKTSSKKHRVDIHPLYRSS